MMKQIANILTGCRIIGSILLLFFPVFSTVFYIIYLFCGFSDMIDGPVARRTNSNSKFGARFDTVADFIFVAISMIKFIPFIHIPGWLWIWIILIAFLKLGNVIGGLFRRKAFFAVHSLLNKITGFLLFLLPLMIQFGVQSHSFTIICCIATISAAHEGQYIRTRVA